jgi:hypothetical protein
MCSGACGVNRLILEKMVKKKKKRLLGHTELSEKVERSQLCCALSSELEPTYITCVGGRL